MFLLSSCKDDNDKYKDINGTKFMLYKNYVAISASQENGGSQSLINKTVLTSPTPSTSNLEDIEKYEKIDLGDRESVKYKYKRA